MKKYYVAYFIQSDEWKFGRMKTRALDCSEIRTAKDILELTKSITEAVVHEEVKHFPGEGTKKLSLCPDMKVMVLSWNEIN